VGDKIKALDEALKATEEQLQDIALRIPNIPDASVPVGKSSEDNPEVRRWGAIPKFSFKVKDHVELGETLKAIAQQGAQVFYRGWIAEAIVDRLKKEGGVLTLEDFIIFKVLSTRERDAEDARAAIRRSAGVLDEPLLEQEIARLADELNDVDVRGRWMAIRPAADSR